MKNLNSQIQSVVDIYKSGNFQNAEELTKKLLASNPKVAFLYNLLGLIFTAQKKNEKAIECYNKGLKIDPKFAMIYSNLGLLLFSKKTSSSIKEAENLYIKSISLNEKIAEPHNNLGNLYNSQNKFEKAEKCYKKAIFINPNFSQAYYNLGTQFVTLGKFDDAKKQFREAINLNINFSEAHKSLSRISKYRVSDEHFNELKKLYKQTPVNNIQSRINLGYALGKAYEDIKKYDESFKFYKEANLLCRKKIDFSLKNEKNFFNTIKSVFNKKLFSKFHSSGIDDNSSIFIVGMPRSGTTLIEQILSSHSKVFGADEAETIPYLIKKYFVSDNLKSFFVGDDEVIKENLKKIGIEYISKMKDFSNKSERITDKLPINFIYIGLIKLILPKSKIIHCHRNSKDNIFSIFKNHFPDERVAYSHDLRDMVEYYNLYYDLMNYWTNTLDNFVYNIKYENLIFNTESEVRNLLKFCNLGWSSDCLNFHNNKRPIKTASDTQARSKIYKSSINSWKCYEKHLNKYFYALKI